jgi:hypothetical protein
MKESLSLSPHVYYVLQEGLNNVQSSPWHVMEQEATTERNLL